MSASLFGNVQPFAGDPILSLNAAFAQDPRPNKINLSIGVYTDESGRVPVLESVARATGRIGGWARPYLPMEGHAAYRKLAREVVFGADHPALAEGRVATIQSLGGTGAVAVAADFLAAHCPGRQVYISDPTWDNHHGLFRRAGFETRTYPYWDAAARALAFDAMAATLDAAPEGSIVVIQPVCHNPTGVDLTPAQQQAIGDLLIRKRHIAVFDMAYQGFGEGLDADAAFVRSHAERGASFFVANSFSKTFSLYGERCGSLSAVCADADEADRVLGQLKLAVRRSYSSPPSTGALLVATVLGDAELAASWRAEVEAMRVRMARMRQRLAEEIRARSNTLEAGFLTQQRGMFGYTGLSVPQVRAMRERDAIYLVESGRMCVAGLTDANVATVAASMISVATEGA